MRISRRLIARLLTLAVAALATTTATRGQADDTASTPQIHDMTLRGARVSESAGRVVVTLDARGDLRGLVTLTLTVSPDGTVTRGDWALVASHIEDLNPDGSVAARTEGHDEGDRAEPVDESPDTPVEEHHDESSDAPHQEFIRFVNIGTLGGDVVGGFVGTGTDGGLALVNLQLRLTNATLTFASASGGDGNLDADLGRRGAQGSLRLRF